MKTTLNKIRKLSPCESGWTKLLKHLGKTQADDAPLEFLTILKSNGLDDALWCLKSAPIDCQLNVRMYAVWCAKQVEHLMNDDSKNALVVAQNHAIGLATDAACDAAWDDAWDAARDAARAADAAGDATDAAMAAAAAARAAAGAAARAAAWGAARAAAWGAASAALVAASWGAASGWAADAAEGAAWDDAWDAACDAARAVHESMFIKMCEGSAPWQQ